jgi:phosphotransferase system enzyme I (PtsP)
MDHFAAEADFFSIGTNDLVQYMLAADRTNEKVAEYYIPHHPAILKAIQVAVSSAKSYGKRISICGDMAHNEKYLPFFIGIGVRELSIDASYIPKVQDTISKINSLDAAELVSELMTLRKTSEIQRMLR